jgi:hypothetical protein
MSDERKNTGVWPWIAALLIGLPVLYVASFGPACWTTSRMNRGAGLIPLFYRPVVAAYESVEDDSALARVFLWYSTIGAADHWNWFAVASGSTAWELVWCPNR